MGLSYNDSDRGPAGDGAETAVVLTGLLVQAGSLLLAGAGFALFSGPRLGFLLIAAGFLSLLTLVVLAAAMARATDLEWGRFVVLAQLVVQLALLLVLGAVATDEIVRFSSVGPAEEAEWVLIGIGLTGGLLVGCGRALLRRGGGWTTPARRAVSVLGIFLVGALLCAGVAATALQAKPFACSLYSLDHESWADAGGDDKQQIAETLLRCDTLTGKSASEVQEMFGPGPSGRARKLYLGTVNDLLGPGDAQILTISFGDDGRVSSARLSEPVD